MSKSGAIGKRMLGVGRITVEGTVYRVGGIEVIIDKVKGTEPIPDNNDFEYVVFEFHAPEDWGIRAANWYYKGGEEKKRTGKVYRRKP